ncbi:MAG: CoA synthetase, partial [SAR324 cluster bacterium]|nr:CoA synthetase [SAR324 cluster bacterium]
MGVPYVPVIGLVGSNLLDNRDDMTIQPDPFDPSHSSVVARAYRPDVALLHGLKADRHGNVYLGRESDDVLLAEASRRVIVTVETIVDRLDDSEMERALPSLLVDAIAETPSGAHPAGC